MIPNYAINEIVETLLKDDQSYCECRRSPFDKHDVNPPCATRVEMTNTVRKTLELAAPHLPNAANAG